MSMRNVEFVVLCEDAQHKSFIVRCLRRLGFNQRLFRVRPYPAGARSGEQWVREQYPDEVTEQRRRSNYTSASLVAITDADTLSVEERIRRLDDALHEAGCLRRRDGERIALVVPRRNIESWIHFFESSGTVDETADFKPKYRNDAKGCRDAADAAVELCRRSDDESTAPPSLITACSELRRIARR